MYFVVVLLFLFVLPSASVAMAALHSHHSLLDPVLIARWWTFWAVGVRLFIAGLRQVVQPRFTAEEIFEIRDAGVLPIVRELGFANLSMGFIALCSLVRLDWTIPAAIVGGLYYGLAGLGHIGQRNKNTKESTAMISDIFACLVLLIAAFKCMAWI
jgi:hypothetical protein